MAKKNRKFRINRGSISVQSVGEAVERLMCEHKFMLDDLHLAEITHSWDGCYYDDGPNIVVEWGDIY